MTVCV